ncbi:MAG: hypothetical protein ACQKBU_12140 [Verrucomicrobiales bacterium]
MSPTARKRRRRGSVTGAAARAHDEAEAEGLVRKAAEILGVDGRREALEGRGRFLDEKALLVLADKDSHRSLQRLGGGTIGDGASDVGEQGGAEGRGGSAAFAECTWP